MRGALGYILTSSLPNNHFGKRLGVRDMTICGFLIGSHIPNIGNMGTHIPNIGYKRYMAIYSDIRGWVTY